MSSYQNELVEGSTLMVSASACSDVVSSVWSWSVYSVPNSNVLVTSAVPRARVLDRFLERNIREVVRRRALWA